MKNDGQVIVEFAIIVSLFLVLVLGAVDYAFYMYARYNLEGAVRNALRYAVREKDWTDPEANQAEVVSRIQDYCDDISPVLFDGIENYVSINITWTGPLMEYISVGVQDYPFTPVVGFADVFVPDTLSSQSVMRF